MTNPFPIPTTFSVLRNMSLFNRFTDTAASNSPSPTSVILRSAFALFMLLDLSRNGFSAETPLEPPSAALFRKLLDEIWEHEIIESPMLATNIGDARGQEQLADDSMAAIQRRAVNRASFLKELLKFDPKELPGLLSIDHELTRLRLKSQLDHYKYQTHLMPINNRQGFHISFPELPREMNPDSVADLENYISRLLEFTRYTDQQITLMRLGVKAGLTQPAIIMRNSASQAEAQVIDDPKESEFYILARESAKGSVSPQQWNRLSESLLQAIETSVIPSYKKFAAFLKEEYLPACRGTVSISAIASGREFYRNQIEHFTTLPLSPEELHQTGISENARIRNAMIAIIERVGFKGDLPAFLQFLRTDPQFYPKTPEELLKEAAYILKKADGRLPELFGHLPRIPYGLRVIPDYVAPQTTSAYYWPPATDGSRGGFYYLNTYNLASRPLYQLEALSLHEAVPGHHLQLAIQAELKNLHPMSRQSSLDAFIEGWALYSERLGKEIGFYEDPYQEFGRLSMEAWRASRLVVDTGIHWFGWSRERAIRYMTENTALSEHNIVAEVDRYIGWPGQALSYKTGELAIRRIRAKSERILQENFDIREFHDRVLEAGSIPLPLLEARIDEWIHEKQQSFSD